jgi:glycosyltransferase involved in cell wall biosynthesis
MKNVLVVAFHFPPVFGSSGLLRTLKFTRYLREEGWRSVVLSVNPCAYEKVDQSQLGEIHRDVPVIRTFTLDAKRDLSVAGWYPRFLAIPDRWSSWCLSGILSGLFAIRKHKIDAIYTTYPIATAVLIGYALHRLSGRPWVVDLRDPMTEDDYPRDPATRKVYRWIEQRAMQYGSRFIFTARSCRTMYLKRYPRISEAQCLLIPNGYDEEDFQSLAFHRPACGNGMPVRLVHSGIIYPEDRDPRPFFRALAGLKMEGAVSAGLLRVDLRAAGSEKFYADIINDLGIDDMIHLLPSLPYRESLQDCATADALLLFQSATCDHQIPAKLYEYLRLNRPILALTSGRGDTAALLRDVGGGTIVDISDEQAIKSVIPEFLDAVIKQTHPLPNNQKTKGYSRRRQVVELARCLDAVGTRTKGKE